jgi:hypothetical protein
VTALRPNWSRPLSRPLKIPGVMDIKTLADVRTLLDHLPKETRAQSTWQHVEAELRKASTGDDQAVIELFAALQTVLMLEGVEFRPGSMRGKQRGEL